MPASIPHDLELFGSPIKIGESLIAWGKYQQKYVVLFTIESAHLNL